MFKKGIIQYLTDSAITVDALIVAGGGGGANTGSGGGAGGFLEKSNLIINANSVYTICVGAGGNGGDGGNGGATGNNFGGDGSNSSFLE